jgi:hypothetical protein
MPGTIHLHALFNNDGAFQAVYHRQSISVAGESDHQGRRTVIRRDRKATTGEGILFGWATGGWNG